MSNERALVDQFVRNAQQQRETPLPDSEAFEHFAASMVLNRHFLTDEEVEAGRIGGGRDGGIDAAYCFLDERLLSEDSDVLDEDFDASSVRRGVDLTLWIVQAKTTPSFAEDAFHRVKSSTEKLLDLNADEAELYNQYSPDVIGRLGIFTSAWRNLSIRSPSITIRFAYVTRGGTAGVSDGVRFQVADMENHLESLVPGAKISVELVGARELWERASATPDYDLQLRFRDYVSEGDSYVGLVSLPDYQEFLSKENGDLRGYLFDWNVRDFQGDVAVNRQMKTTLESDDDRDFWWLNNGVTILCNNANISGDKRFTLSGVQIVNGMQTSHAIHDVLSNREDSSDKHQRRSLQVRIIKTQDAATRDAIIRATNSQTKVPDASLHATEDFHRQLEAHFAGRGWFYDRRKNFYKNAGKPADRIISIPLLGQAIMAIGLGRPDDARARPTTLLNKREDYAAIFNSAVSLDVYLWAGTLQRHVDTFLRSADMARDASVRTNTRFFVSCFIACTRLGGPIFNPSQLSRIASGPAEIGEDEIDSALTVVLGEIDRLTEMYGWQVDRISKSRDLAKSVIARSTS